MRIRLGRKRKGKKQGPPQPSLRERFPDVGEQILSTIEAVSEFTMTSPERLIALSDAVQHISEQKIAGDFVECGVWRGGSTMAAARTLVAMQDTERELWLYDTFDGMSEPGPADVDHAGNDAAHLLAEQDKQDSQSIWCRSPLDEVKQNVRSTGYPFKRFRFVQGKVEETIPNQLPDRISLLRLDTDWYESTLHELEHLYPRLSQGGVLIIDDYGHWQGCRRAVDEYFAKHNISLFLNRIDYTGRLAIKTSPSVSERMVGRRAA